MPIDADNSRYKDLLGCFKNADEGIITVIAPLVGEMVYLEGELERLKAVPWLVVHPGNQNKQIQTPAAKLYAALISRYTDMVNKLASMLRNVEIVEDSPLRAYLKGIGRSD